MFITTTNTTRTQVNIFLNFFDTSFYTIHMTYDMKDYNEIEIKCSKCMDVLGNWFTNKIST